MRLGRAFAQRDVRLALLDEPFRGMDRDRRSALLVEARKRWRDVTLLCVTHDVGETQLFDRVLVVDDGRIVEDGHPERLAAAPSRYRELLDAERESSASCGTAATGAASDPRRPRPRGSLMDDRYAGSLRAAASPPELDPRLRDVSWPRDRLAKALEELAPRSRPAQRR